MRSFSLYTRFLWAQTLTVLAVVVMLGLMFYMERNLTVARLIAERWSPELREAAYQTDTPSPALPKAKVRRSPTLPADATLVPNQIPRNEALLETLRARGLPATRLALQKGTQGPWLWIEVAPTEAGAASLWLGIHEPLVEPDWPVRLVLALGLGTVLVVVASGGVARWLTRPLDALRLRMQAHQPGSLLQDTGPAHQPEAATPTGLRGASTEVLAMDHAWRQTQARLARHERERALMLAGISHDLRSPLGRIRLAAALLPDAPGVAARRESIERNVQVADRLIQSFLDHAQLAALPLDESVDLVQLARELAQQRGARNPDELRTELPQQPLNLHKANATLLVRMVANLLDNAFQHGRPPVCLRVLQDLNDALIEVDDAGAGIAPQHREAAQLAFYRGDPARNTPGTGLGLAIVREGVALLGGRIEFELQADRHCIRLRLPLNREVQPPPGARPSTGEDGGADANC